MITSIADFTTTITKEVTTAHKYMDLYKDYVEAHRLAGGYEFEIYAIAYALGLVSISKRKRC